KLDDDESEMSYIIRMHRGEIKGFMLFGQNPAVSSPNARLQRDAMRQLKWLVALDLFETESASVWYADPEGPEPKTVATEVFLLPAAASTEKDGSVTNTERLVQWHERVVNPPGDCHADLWWVYQLGKRLKALYADSTLERDAPIRNLTWDYDRADPDDGPRRVGEPDAERVLREINGYHTATGEHLKSGAQLAADGSTACGSRLYVGVFPEAGRNLARRLDPTVSDGIFADWGWAWPGNSRVLYNRASADPQGRPWSERKKLIWWNEAEGRWVGHDVPQFAAAKPPDYRPPADARGGAALAGDAPFGAHFDGRGWLFVPFGLSDGPLPEHYEPLESPYHNALRSTQYAPATTLLDDPLNPVAEPLDPAYPLVATTYRVTEQYLSGVMTRHSSWLVELQPAMFVEISPALAAERGVKNLDWVVVSTPRDSIEALALVTERVPTLTVDGKPSHVVGLLWGFGYKGESVGDSANRLSAMALAPTSDIQGSKSFTCQLRAGRLADERPMTPSPYAPLPAISLPISDTPWPAQPEGSIEHDD
ncbi:MAG: molybdopterin dinucleotide binding domain-containing protein, partial [Anaerolineae bacterium]